MLDTEAFREFKQGLNFLRDNYAGRALPHMPRERGASPAGRGAGMRDMFHSTHYLRP